MSEWNLEDRIVLLPWSPGSKEDGATRWSIEQLGGNVAYRQAPSSGHGAYGEDPKTATHEFVPEGDLPATDLAPMTAGDLTAAVESAHREYAGFLEALGRPAFFPVVSASTVSDTGTRYFGKPWMPVDMDWPDLDGEPMSFVLQIDLASMPSRPAELSDHTGLLLFFHARKYDPDNQSKIVVMDPSLPGGLRDAPDGTMTNPALVVSEWKMTTDYPWIETLEEIEGYDKFQGISEGYGSDTNGMVVDVDGNEMSEKDALEKGVRTKGQCFECDKLGGWPRWEQGDDTPEDYEGVPMTFFMQVGNEGVLLGDLGSEPIDWPVWERGQIFVSPGTDEFTFVHACG